MTKAQQRINELELENKKLKNSNRQFKREISERLERLERVEHNRS